MVNKLHLDFETFCEEDIRKVGAIKYSEHPSCEVLMVGWAVDYKPARVCTYQFEKSYTNQELLNLLNNPDVLIFAHNANFERAIIENVAARQLGWPHIDPSRYRCTAAIAASMALPRSLEGVGDALKLPQQKYARGKQLITKFCCPRKQTAKDDRVRVRPTDDPEAFEEFIHYCKLDAEAERAVDKRLKEFHLSKEEQALWLIDSNINFRGLPIDYGLICKAIKIVNDYTKREMDKAHKLTGGIKVTQVKKLLEWLNSEGIDVDNTQKETLLNLKDVPPHVKEVIDIRMKVGSAAVKKLKKFTEVRSDKDCKVRGCLMYHGATTGRWTSRLVQLHNLIRPTIKNPKLIATILNTADLENVEMVYADPLEAVASCIRHMICTKEGQVFNVSDYSAIEARVLAWLAGQDDILDIFRGDGKIYEHTASKIYKKEVTDITQEERFVGKVATLALGYQGGKVAFQKMAKVYKVEIDETEAEKVKTEWRESNKAIVSFWGDIQKGAIKAVKTNKTYTVGKIKIGVHDIFLLVKLPSGRKLSYPYPEIGRKKMPWGMVDELTFYGQIEQSTKWGRISTYGGKLVENITQAVARDLMANGMVNAEASGYKIVLTVHDELIAETDEDFGSIEEFNELICKTPLWAEGLPLTAEGYRQTRYKK